MNSLTLIMWIESSAMKLNNFSHAPLPVGASRGQCCWHLIVLHVDLILVHVANPLGVNLVHHARIFMYHLTRYE